MKTLIFTFVSVFILVSCNQSTTNESTENDTLKSEENNETRIAPAINKIYKGDKYRPAKFLKEVQT